MIVLFLLSVLFVSPASRTANALTAGETACKGIGEDESGNYCTFGYSNSSQGDNVCLNLIGSQQDYKECTDGVTLGRQASKIAPTSPTTPVPGGLASASTAAQNNCKSQTGSAYAGCLTGYDNPSSSTACNKYSGNAKTACQNAQKKNAPKPASPPASTGPVACTKAQTDALNGNNFFFFDHWWEYLPLQQDSLGNCAPHVTFPTSTSAGNFWLIGLAVVVDLIRVAGFVAFISIIAAGAQLVLAEGNPEKATNARNRLINSLIGVAIAFSATAVVTLVGNTIGGGASAASGLPNAGTANTIKDLLNVVFAILGALGFLFIVIAGFRFVVSSDNPTKVAEARRQILYIALGLLVISVADTIINFIINRLAGT